MSYSYSDVVRTDILAMVPPDGDVVGSIGCGRAATEQVLVEAGREVHGVDVSTEAIAVAESRLTSARLIDVTGGHGFARRSLDGLILADVIEHLPHAWESLTQFTQAVRPGGWVVISVPNMRNLKVMREFVLRGEWPEEETGIFDSTHIQVMTQRRLVRWCESAGLAPEVWFDTYLSKGTRTERKLKFVDRLTLRRGHDWFLAQLQVRCRVLP